MTNTKILLPTFGLVGLLVGWFIWGHSQAAFQDVSSQHSNVDAINYVKSKGIVSGYSDGTYKPDKTINRAEFTKIVIESQFQKSEIDACKEPVFIDVPTDQWFAKYICVAKKNNIIKGYPNGTFKPAKNISFVEAAKIIVTSFGYSVGTDNVWYKPFVQKLSEEKTIPTSIENLEKNITRGEMAEMIYRLKASIKNKASKTYAMLSGEKSEAPQQQKAPVAVEDSVIQEGKITLGTSIKKDLSILDMSVNVNIETTGELDYKIDKTQVIGNGSGSVDVTLRSDIGIAKCVGKKHIPIKFGMNGSYDKKSNLMKLKSHSVSPKNDVMILECPSPEYGDITYELAIPVVFVAEEITLPLENNKEITKNVKHPIADWDMEIGALWKFKVVFAQDFDFDVDVDPPVVTVTQGGAATPFATTKLLKGRGTVKLTVTQWPTIKSFIVNTAVTPTETTTLTLETSCDTKPGEYLFTVQAETDENFKTSVDSVNLVVTKNLSCP